MPNGSRVRVTVRAARSWMAIAYMPRNSSAYAGPSRSQRCNGGSQSLLEEKFTPSSPARNSR